MPRISINGKEFEVPDGTNVLEACLANDIKLEHFCYHRYLPVDGNCRTCMVEIETPRGPMLTIGCNTKVADGMVVHTESEKAETAQKSALEFLLLDHPLDCPICDKAGECKLQDHYMDFGQYDHRRIVPRFFKEGKAVDAGDHIILDQERCVLCTRCTRFLDNVPGTSELGIIRRGHESTITTFPGKTISNDYSGNITDVCPVGALTLKEFRFKQRVWFLKKAKSVCQGCARGCSITVEHNRNRVYRYMPRENKSVNRAWMCDDGRFSFTRLEENRLAAPLMKGAEVKFESAASSLEEVLRTVNPSELGAIVGGSSSLETMYALKKLFDHIGSSNLAVHVPAADGRGDDLLKLPSHVSNENGAKFLGLSADSDAVAAKVASGEIKTLIVVELDLLGAQDRARFEGIRKAANLIVLALKADETAKSATIAIPVRNFVETNGTFVNATSLLQAARQAYEPENGDRLLAPAVLVGEIASIVGVEGFRYNDPVFVFDWMVRENSELSGFRFSTLPDAGVQLKIAPIAPPPFKDMKVDFNVFPEQQGARV